MNRGGEPADGTPLLLGITKTSLSTDALISAAVLCKSSSPRYRAKQVRKRRANERRYVGSGQRLHQLAEVDCNRVCMAPLDVRSMDTDAIPFERRE